MNLPALAALLLAGLPLEPDLEVTALGAFPEAVRAGTPVRLSATVRNVGEQASPPSTAAFHLVRTYGAAPTSPTPLGVVSVPALGVRESAPLTLDVTIASVPHGGDAAWMVAVANNVRWAWAGTVVSPSVTWNQTYHGPRSSGFGAAVCGVGDVNGDGFDDVIVGAPDDGTAGAGLARVLSGRTGATIRDFHGWAEGDRLGRSVGAAGDVDGDGVPDVIVGARGASGRVQVFSGRTGSPLRFHVGASDEAETGRAVAGVGDVDGDGYDDYAIAGRDAGDGLVAVYSGRTGARVFAHRGEGSTFGCSLAPAGDVDRDGVPDLIVGAPAAFPHVRGTAHVISGSSGRLLHRLFGPADFGRSVAGAGDVDGDGVPDLAVGAPGDAAGSLALFSGRTSQVIAILHGWTRGERFGSSVSAAGDLDGDGVPDFVVGAPDARPWGIGSGRADVISGRTFARLYSCQGWAPGSRFGSALALVRDVNGDGRPDLFVGAPGVSGLQILFSSEKAIGRATTFARPGATSGGTLPRAGVGGSPQIGQAISLTLRAAPPATPVLLLLGFVPTDVDLGPAGAPGNRLYTTPTLTLPLATGADGRAALPIALPDGPGLVGVQAFLQWAILDPPANALGVVTSDAARIVIGRL